MSHFAVLIVGESPEWQLAPFSEELEMPEYKVGLVAKTERQEFFNFYTKVVPGKEYGVRSEQEAIKNKKLSFDKLYNKYGDDWNNKEWRKDKNGKWSIYSTYNPKSKWDWYSLGGRWSGLIKLKKGVKGKMGTPGIHENKTGIDQAKKGDITNLDKIKTFAILKDGKWHEKGEMGYWAIVHKEKTDAKWNSEVKKLIKSIPDDTLISIYDCHI